MPRLAQYDYLFFFGLFFASMDAYGIGANDVANSFATSVSSRSLKLWQACIAAAIMEFLGAVLAGSRVATTIRSGIIDIEIFQEDPAMLLLAMVCAIAGSSIWLIFATRHHMPVSTTHSIVGALVGVGIAAGGADSVKWEWDGLGQVFATWGVAPLIAGGFAAVVYLLTKYLVLKRKDSTKAGLIMSPFWFFAVTVILTLTILWKGSPNLGLAEMSIPDLMAAVFGTATVVCALACLFWLPFVYCRVVRGDYTIKWYHFFYGPFLWKRVPPEDAHSFTAPDAVPDYYKGHHTTSNPAPQGPRDHENAHSESQGDSVDNVNEHEDEREKEKVKAPRERGESMPAMLREVELPQIEGAWIEPKNLYIIARYHSVPFLKRALFGGIFKDVVSLQTSNPDDAKRLADVHSRAAQYDNKTEHLYSFLQVMTACTASFAHGSNDISNAVGPFATIYETWHTGNYVGGRTPVPTWILVYGAIWLVIGLATYGYNIMRILGNRLTLHSPTRGFSMELGAAITVVLASQLALPVSTTQCITGATAAVGLCNGDLKSINWKGITAGCLFGIIANAPRFGMSG
ncbi:phosphate transporter [Dendrothele bispora CBS 962.96]|uniref:Phosphate transporter n=1 Tax=Dendrothele bispora (strain CBS 962.96) TaxID=1314807 RepID=A0A4S8MF73_DENBC|nr:phosphate transporter [Dendrothele bispora CBS 962.96]